MFFFLLHISFHLLNCATHDQSYLVISACLRYIILAGQFPVLSDYFVFQCRNDRMRSEDILGAITEETWMTGLF